MSENIKPAENNTLLLVGLGIIAALLIFAAVSNRPVPLISDERTVMILLVVIGMAMCAVGGITPTLAKYGWTSPGFIIGAVLGVLMLLIPAAVLVGIKLPLIGGEHEAIIALAILGVAKIVINLVLTFLMKGTG
ncbi:MAG: hypothetical protein ABI690_20990 [Chloroflexota bacterium]